MNHYTWVKKASQTEKQQMQECADCENELANEYWEVHGYTLHHHVEKTKSGYTLVAVVATVCDDSEFKVGQIFGRASFVRCSWCGAVRELYDGQGEFCTSCNADWEKPIAVMQARLLWNEYKKEYTFMNGTEARKFRNKITKLSRKTRTDDLSYTFAVQYLDNLSLHTGARLEYTERA